MNILGWNATFDSVATLAPPRSLVIDASPPGFRTMKIEWLFEENGAGGTRIGLIIHYQAGNFLARRFSRPWVRAFAGIQVRAFIERMKAVDSHA